MAQNEFDLIIVGGGPGGYVGAIRAAQLGLRTALVERAELGGICLNWGCIPTKSLLHTADLYRELKRGEEFGLVVPEPSFDFAKLIERSRQVAAQLNRGVRGLMRKNKVQVFEGHAKLRGSRQVSVERNGESTAELGSNAIVLATGARARTLPGIEPDGERVWTYREAMIPEALPGSLLVIGSGAIGIEFASFYRALGSEVTVVEILPQILPVEDEEIAALARKAFEREGIEIHTGAKVESLAASGDGLAAVIQTEEGRLERSFERAILSVGVIGNTEELGLEETQIKVEAGFIRTDEWFETDEPGLYAIGDVAGPPCLAHKASHEAVICVERIAGRDVRPLHRERIPGCTYCHPQIASIGLSERAALDAGHEIRVGRFPLIGNGKAIAIGDAEGLVKTVFARATGELLGAHLVGPGVTELIQGFAIAMGLETTESELIDTIFPHPTISEAMHESVLSAYDRVLHI